MFTLIDLPYKSLAPVISDQTLAFHHGKHLQAYLDNLNKLIVGTEYESLYLEEIIVRSSLPAPTGNPAIFNNAGQILNHNLYFTQFSPKPSMTAPTGKLLVQIEKQWGSVDTFKAEFETEGVGLFGSGWVWLASDAAGTLSILQCPGADTPYAHGLRPILTFDVWEHAYYLDYQNRRAAHLTTLWDILDWRIINARFKEVR